MPNAVLKWAVSLTLTLTLAHATRAGEPTKDTEGPGLTFKLPPGDKFTWEPFPVEGYYPAEVGEEFAELRKQRDQVTEKSLREAVRLQMEVVQALTRTLGEDHWATREQQVLEQDLKRISTTVEAAGPIQWVFGNSSVRYMFASMAASRSALYRVMSGDYLKAKEELLKELEHHSELGDDARQELAYSALLSRLAMVEYLLNRPSSAAAWAEEAREFATGKLGEDSPRLAMVGVWSAKAHLALGDDEKAEESLRQAVDIFKRSLPDENPQDSEAFALLAALKFKNGKPWEARLFAEQAFDKTRSLRLPASGHDQADHLLYAGVLMLQSRQFDQSIRLLERLEADAELAEPSFPEAFLKVHRQALAAARLSAGARRRGDLLQPPVTESSAGETTRSADGAAGAGPTGGREAPAAGGERPMTKGRVAAPPAIGHSGSVIGHSPSRGFAKSPAPATGPRTTSFTSPTAPAGTARPRP